jgi:tetratricopeptide (TPR) repeat protein
MRPNSFWSRNLPALAVSLAACAVFAQTVAYGYAADDIGVIRDRPLFHDLGRWREILVTPWWPHALYRPLSALSLAANWHLGGGDPATFHAVNVLLHAAATLLVFLLARRLLGVGAGAAAAVVFAVHPVHVESVANIVGRAEVLATIFAVGTVLLYQSDGALADAGDGRSWRRWATTVGTLGGTVLALASKESAFALPGLLLLIDWFDARTTGRTWAAGVRRHWLLWCGAVVVAFGWLVFRSRVVHDLTGLEVAPGLDDQGLVGRTLIMLPVVLEYARLFLVPAHLSAEYGPNYILPTPYVTAAGAAGLALVAGCVWAALAARKRAPAVTFALAWVGGAVLIVANILVPTGVILAERTLYLASVGVALLAGAAWAALRPRAPTVALAALALVAAAGAARTMTRNPIWRDDRSYYPAMVVDAPGSFRSDWTAAELARQRGDLAASEQLLRRSLATYPLAWAAWRDLGRLMYAQGRFREAAEFFWAASRLIPWSSLDAQLAIQSSLQAGMVDTAEARLAVARAALPQSSLISLAASDVALARGRPMHAMTLRRLAAWANPDSARYWALTADAAALAGYCPELRRSLDRVRSLGGDAAWQEAMAGRAEAMGCR